MGQGNIFRKDVVVIGSDYSGAVLSAQRLRRAPKLSIGVFEKNPALAPGLAYATDHLSLFEHGLVREDPLALGLDVDANGALFDPMGPRPLVFSPLALRESLRQTASVSLRSEALYS